MRLEGTGRSKEAARSLRQSMSPPEVALWSALRRAQTGARFRRQYAAGPYILDFYCVAARLAIEVDGEAHNRGDRPTRDEARTRWLSARGVTVLRVAAVDIDRDLDAVIRSIAAAVAGCIEAPPSAPSVSR